MTHNLCVVACLIAVITVGCKGPTEAERNAAGPEASAQNPAAVIPEPNGGGKGVIPAASTEPPVTPMVALTLNDFDMAGFGKALGGWDDKSKTAAKYKSADSNYRTYKPTVSPTSDGGLFISTKIDHIRGGDGDDHAQLEITFDRAGKVVSSKATLALDGAKSLDTETVTAAFALAGASAGTTAAVAVGAEVFKALGKFVKTEHGGRANFPAVVQHNFNHIVAHVRQR